MTLSKRQLAYFEELFADYHNYQKKINLRKAELSIRELDENVGGGKSNIMSKSLEIQVIREMSDKKLQFLERAYNAITSIIEESSDDTLKVINCRFFQNNGLNSWSTVASILGISVKKVYQVRYQVLEKFGNKVGLCNTSDD